MLGRQPGHQEQMAQLDAARKVNDPARVIELYQGIVPSLDAERREELARDLAKWFLELIHRRLRTGKIQAEVVLLATQVAETFGATVEGASMRAALPTLRRSVGLCPRCAQPYTGTADACPQCSAGVSGSRRQALIGPAPDSVMSRARLDRSGVQLRLEQSVWTCWNDRVQDNPKHPA